MSTYCHGIASCQAIDKSGEIVDIKGLDISSLASTGIINYEHKSDIPGQVCGKILTAKKIFDKSDCSNANETYFWNKCKVPFVYITAELLDDYCQSGKDAAGLLRYDHDKKGQNKNAILGFSIEGSEIPGSRKGTQIMRSIARKCTLTASPCNLLCVAEILENPNQKSKVKDDFSQLFKSDQEAITLFKSGQGDSMYETYLAKATQAPKNFPKPPAAGATSAKTPAQSGWTASSANIGKDGTMVSYHHPVHGIVSVKKDKDSGDIHVKHNGGFANTPTQPGVFQTAAAAGKHVTDYLAGVSSGAIKPPQSYNVGSGMTKSEEEDAKKANIPERTKLASVHGWPVSMANHGGTIGQAVTFQHPKDKDKTVVVHKLGDKYHVRTGGGHAGLMGKKPIFDTPAEAMAHAKEYIKAVNSGRVAMPGIRNVSSISASKNPKKDDDESGNTQKSEKIRGKSLNKDSSPPEPNQANAAAMSSGASQGFSMSQGLANLSGELGFGKKEDKKKKNLKKALEAGSTNAAPSTLTSGACYQKESIGVAPKKKKDWNKIAKEGYDTWAKREEFESFMKSRMPGLADGEIRAIGRVVHLKKSLDFEKSLAELIPSLKIKK